MRKRAKGVGPKVHALDPDETLFETGTREVWQALLTTSDGEEIGPVVRQVIEPKMYTVRYLVVYDVVRERHVLVPSNTIVEIAEGRVHASLASRDVAQLPPFSQSVTRSFEEGLYQAVGRTPYWVEEAAAMARRDDDPPIEPTP